MAYKDNSDIMKAFFGGKIKYDIPKTKIVELGHGKGVGYHHGSYSQYIHKVSEQGPKGNGFIYIGKNIIENETFSMPETTDKFTEGDIPKLLIMYNNIINEIVIKVLWKDSENETILEEYYQVPTAYSGGNYWWESYGILFIGPEELKEGDYKVEIISEELISREQTIGERGENIKTFSVSLEFTIDPKKD